METNSVSSSVWTELTPNLLAVLAGQELADHVKRKVHAGVASPVYGIATGMAFTVEGAMQSDVRFKFTHKVADALVEIEKKVLIEVRVNVLQGPIDRFFPVIRTIHEKIRSDVNYQAVGIETSDVAGDAQHEVRQSVIRLSSVTNKIESEVEEQFFDKVHRPIIKAYVGDVTGEAWASVRRLSTAVNSGFASFSNPVVDSILDMTPADVSSKSALAVLIDAIQETQYKVFEEVAYDEALKKVSAECYRSVQASSQSAFNAIELALEAIGNDVKMTCPPALLYLQEAVDVEAGEDMFGLSKHRVAEGVYDATHLPVDEVFSSVESTLDRIIATGTVESQVSFIKLMYLQDQVSNRASSDMRLSVRNLTAASVLFPVAEPINPLRSSIEASLGIEE
jgi:hypothetical protein